MDARRPYRLHLRGREFHHFAEAALAQYLLEELKKNPPAVAPPKLPPARTQR